MLQRYPHKNIVSILFLVVLLLISFTAQASEQNEIPVKDMVTMVDLGADTCIPCKLMAPILEKLEVEYKGKAAIVFIDVWKNPDHAKKYGIRVIPTQIFFDKNGTEKYRHVGFMDEKDIRKEIDAMLAI